MRPTIPAPQLRVNLLADPSNSAIGVGLRLKCTLELPPLPFDVKFDAPSRRPEATGRGLSGEAATTTRLPDAAAAGPTRAYSLLGEGTPLGRVAVAACSLASPMAREVRPLAPTTGVARTASEVKPLAPTTGVKTTAGDVRPLAAAIGVEKTASDVRPF